MQGKKQRKTAVSPRSGAPLPEGKPFQPGQSGNPAGYSKERRFQKAIFEHLEKYPNDLPKGIKKAFDQFKKGSHTHLKVLSEIADGKPEQPVKVDANINFTTDDEQIKSFMEKHGMPFHT